MYIEKLLCRSCLRDPNQLGGCALGCDHVLTCGDLLHLLGDLRIQCTKMWGALGWTTDSGGVDFMGSSIRLGISQIKNNERLCA